MRVAVRHATRHSTEPIFRTGELTVDLARRDVLVAGGKIDLTPVEYGLLKALITHAGKVLTHGHLLAQIWGPGWGGDRLKPENLEVLRDVLRQDPGAHWALTGPSPIQENANRIQLRFGRSAE